MAVSGCLRPFFLFSNCLFSLIGLFLVGFTFWNLATNPTLAAIFTEGTAYFTYTTLTVGLVVVTTGIFGCVGGLIEGNCPLKTYIVCLALLLLLEVAGSVAAYIRRDELDGYRMSAWSDLNTDSKNFIQRKLKCCGLVSFTDYVETISQLPDTCFTPGEVKASVNMYISGCWSKINGWLLENVATWACTIAVVVVLELLCLLLAALILAKISRTAKVSARRQSLPVKVESETVQEASKTGGGVNRVGTAPPHAAVLYAARPEVQLARTLSGSMTVDEGYSSDVSTRGTRSGTQGTDRRDRVVSGKVTLVLMRTSSSGVTRGSERSMPRHTLNLATYSNRQFKPVNY